MYNFQDENWRKIVPKPPDWKFIRTPKNKYYKVSSVSMSTKQFAKWGKKNQCLDEFRTTRAILTAKLFLMKIFFCAKNTNNSERTEVKKTEKVPGYTKILSILSILQLLLLLLIIMQFLDKVFQSLRPLHWAGSLFRYFVYIFAIKK